MRGLELNCNLLAAGAEFICETTTAAVYRLWTIHDAYPAMLRDEKLGTSITVEVWQLTPAALIKVLQRDPPGLCLGRVELQDGEIVLGMLAEPYLVSGHEEITRWGGWREYLKRKT